MWCTYVSCLKSNFTMVTVTCIIAYIVWLFLYPSRPCNGSVESEIKWNLKVSKLAYFFPYTSHCVLYNIKSSIWLQLTQILLIFLSNQII
jgi:hypothetical protein